MKTISNKMILMFFGLIIMKQMQSQSLNISTNITGSGGNQISVNYVLLCSDGHVYSGYGSTIKERLQLNNTYSIIFSKQGYKSKTVHISTFVMGSKTFNFNFNIELEELPGSDYGKLLQTQMVKVFYDNEKNNFNYKTL
jgi:hypothetical protein